ncbi:MAG TPA: MaoC family dehydratase [Verrucomicrobiae bacterium]|jgi:acyl dehydratase|nr:MaoC family dehydratase [Verrucomicrobiae bacterium]
MSERYFEDFRVGDRYRSADYNVTEAEIVEYARRYDPQSFHTDPVAAKRSLFGGLVASGWYTAAITMRLIAQSEPRVAGGLIGLGVEQLRWPQPVRPGDVLHVEVEVLDLRPSRSHPDHGIVRVRNITRTQTGETVQTMETALWVLRRGQ